VKVNPADVGGGVAVMVPEVTLRVTVTVAGLPAALGEVTVTVPVYAPGERPAPLTEIERDPGVVPVVGVTESQFVPATPLFAVAVKLRTPGLPVTCTVCAGGFVPLLV